MCVGGGGGYIGGVCVVVTLEIKGYACLLLEVLLWA